MKKNEIKKGKFYESNTGAFVECVDDKARVPAAFKFKLIPFGYDRMLSPREIKRELSPRETEVLTAMLAEREKGMKPK